MEFQTASNAALINHGGWWGCEEFSEQWETSQVTTMPFRVKVKSSRPGNIRIRNASTKRKRKPPTLPEPSCHILPVDHENLQGTRYSHNPYPTCNQPLTDIMSNQHEGPNVPTIFKRVPPIKDSLTSETSIAQDETVQECLPFLAGEGVRSLFDYNSYGIPSLDREKHIEYLHERLGELPAGFVAYDAARPWLIYWTLTGLCLLGENVDQYRSRSVGPAECTCSC